MNYADYWKKHHPESSQEHTKRIPHANHSYQKAKNRTKTTTKGSARSMKIR